MPGSLGLLPSGPDPVGERPVRHQPPGGHIGDWEGKCKGVGGLAADRFEFLPFVGEHDIQETEFTSDAGQERTIAECWHIFSNA